VAGGALSGAGGDAAADQRRIPDRLGDPRRVARLSVIAAAGLALLKLVTGLVTGSLGFLAEAAHSGTDLAAAILTLLALRVALRPPDRDHPYGHGKAEHLAALGEGIFLVLVSGVIAAQAVARLTGESAHDVEATWWAFAVIAVVLAVDLSRALISARAARRHGSAALAANAVHFASDFAGTLAVLAGLLLARSGTPEGDAVAALVVAVLVVIAAVRLMRENVHVLMDREPPGAAEAVREALAIAEPRAEVRRVRTREAGGRAFVDVVLAISADAALAQAHVVADGAEAAIRAALPGSDVTVHMEPQVQGDLRERATGAALSVRRVREVHNVRTSVVGGRTTLSLHVKFPAQETLRSAHEAADRVEAAIVKACPEIDQVHVHIEPLAPPADARVHGVPGRADHCELLAAAVEELTGSPPLEVELHVEPRGLVAFLTLGLPGSSTVADAHAVAARVETRAREVLPELVEVVVHTEPR
jgi:cation diffusion facilitator family transporter